MSRIGKQIIEVPAGVTVVVKDGEVVVGGPKGEWRRALHPAIKINLANNQVTVDVANKTDQKELSLWGTFAAHLKNMVTGVSSGFKKQLEVNGVGYRVSIQGAELKLEVGFSQPVVYHLPAGMQATVEKNLITLESVNKELLGQVAAEIRAIRPPEPYKGKGIKYVDELIRRKDGKAATKGAGAA